MMESTMQKDENNISNALRFLARNKESRQFFKENSWLYQALLKCAKRYIAGENLAEMLEKAVRLQKSGYNISLEYMGGEDTKSVEKCSETTREFIRLIKQSTPVIDQPNICFDLSVIGLSVSDDITIANLSQIASIAKLNDSHVIISMEEHPKTEKILEIYKYICQEHDNVGITIQAYLHRTISDIDDVAELPGKIRLVKGVYHEPEQISLKRSDELDHRYMQCLDRLIEQKREIVLGTHDSEIIKRLVSDNYFQYKKLVIEMLHGACPNKLRQLKEEGYPVNLCLAYGKEWYLHLLHRLAEYPPNIFKAVVDFVNPNNIHDEYYY